jgi:hypothetical protein
VFNFYTGSSLGLVAACFYLELLLADPISTGLFSSAIGLVIMLLLFGSLLIRSQTTAEVKTKDYGGLGEEIRAEEELGQAASGASQREKQKWRWWFTLEGNGSEPGNELAFEKSFPGHEPF